MNECERLREQNIKKTPDSVKAYLPPLSARFVRGLSAHTGQSESRVVCDIIREKINSLTEPEKQRILNSQK